VPTPTGACANIVCYPKTISLNLLDSVDPLETICILYIYIYIYIYILIR
jgi:hypothetical protein